jgi:hypothetical protein
VVLNRMASEPLGEPAPSAGILSACQMSARVTARIVLSSALLAGHRVDRLLEPL